MLDQSLWQAVDAPRFGTSPIPNEVDVVIIGAGITGLTAAYLLKQAGKSVAVFDRDRIGSGETGNTSAHLTYVTDARIATLSKQFGADAAKLIWHAGDVAIDLIESIVSEQAIDCGFRRVPGFLCSPFVDNDDRTQQLRDDASTAAALGFSAIYSERGPIAAKPAIRFADQALFDPLAYLARLAQLIDGGGSVVRELAEVGEVIQDPHAVIVNGQTVACSDIVIATHVPMVATRNLVGATLFQTKLYPYSSYVMGGRVGDDSPPAGLYSDTADPYYFLRVHEDERGKYAIFGGCDHKTGQESDTEARFAQLQIVFSELIPSAAIERRWSGQVIETDDGLPFIGQTAEHEYAATGYAGNGLTFGTIAGVMLHDAITGRANPWRNLFDPHRKPASVDAVATLAREATDYPYYYVADRLKRGSNDVRSVAPGEGKVLTLGGQRVACHRNADGQLVKVSAVCTHMGCLVRWNTAESTWDCPCHGSRFTPDGLVIGGPAEAPLEPIDG